MPALSGSQKAVMYAQAAVARSGATRCNYTSPKVFLTIAGVHYGTSPASASQRVEGLTITEQLNEIPNTAAFTAKFVDPLQGQEVIITLGSKNNFDRLFAGTILNRSHRYVGSPSNWHAPINVIDYTWHLTRRLVSGTFTNTSGTQIANAIIASFPGFTSGVLDGLPTLDVFSYTNVTMVAALSQLAQRIGGYWDVDYRKVVKEFVTDTSVTNPTALTSTHPSLEAFEVDYDLSQVLTRVFAEGGGVNALATCAVGETILPVSTVGWYNAAGGLVMTGAQRITYGGVFVGGGGTLVGPGASPSAAPVLAPNAGTGLGSGTYQYAYTDVTAAGESLPSPLGTVVTGVPLADPTSFPNTATYDNAGAILDDGFHDWAYTWLDSAGGETLPSPRVTRYSSNGLATAFTHPLPLGPAGTAQRRLYRTSASASSPTGLTLKLVATIADNTTTSYRDAVADASLGAAAPGANNTTSNRVSVSGIAVGPSTPVAVTSRKLYRTAVGASQLKLLTTIADNTTTTYADSTADGSLGANVVTSDTSTLAQPSGQVLAGAATLLIAGTGSASATGGWAIIGNGQQVIRYTGLSGNTLTGIPTSGIGAITASVSYNSTVTFAPALIGVPASGTGAVLYSILLGDPLNVLVQVDDNAAQTALAALLGGTDSGVVEGFIQDGRLGETEAKARATALLAFVSTTLVTIRYTSRDRNTHAGRTISVNLGSPTSVVADFKIQSVQIDTFSPGINPTYHVQASSHRFSLENLLRLVTQTAGIHP